VAFLVLHGYLLKTVWNPNLLAGDPKQTGAAAMLGLLESTEDRIPEMLLKNSKTDKRMLKSFDLEPHSSNAPFPGGARGPQYRAPSFPTHPEASILPPDQNIYNGNCHCGAVMYAVKTKPLEEQKVMKCNCSLCSRVCLSSPLPLSNLKLTNTERRPLDLSL
jgi:hypothetical protein